MVRKISLLWGVVALFLTVEVKAQNTPDSQKLIRQTAEMAKERNIPLIQVAYHTPEEHLVFESSQREEIVADSKAQTVFQAASISKVVFSYIVMRLVDRGVIDLDKPLYKYTNRRLDSRFCNACETRAESRLNEKRAKKLTARIVLHHRTGLPNWAKGNGGKPNKASLPLIFKYEPGERYTYSGEGIWYLQRVIEHLTGKSLEELAREEVFEPLGMVNSSYIWLPRYKELAAYGYNAKGERRGQGFKNVKLNAGNAAYTLRTNVHDLSCFVEALMEGRGLSPEIFKEMTTSLVPAPKATTCFGLGIRVTPNLENPRDLVWHHNGSNTNFRCRFLLFPERKSYLIYFTNSAKGAGETHRLMREIFFPDYKGTKL